MLKRHLRNSHRLSKRFGRNCDGIIGQDVMRVLARCGLTTKRASWSLKNKAAKIDSYFPSVFRNSNVAFVPRPLNRVYNSALIFSPHLGTEPVEQPYPLSGSLWRQISGHGGLTVSPLKTPRYSPRPVRDKLIVALLVAVYVAFYHAHVIPEWLHSGFILGVLGLLCEQLLELQHKLTVAAG